MEGYFRVDGMLMLRWCRFDGRLLMDSWRIVGGGYRTKVNLTYDARRM